MKLKLDNEGNENMRVLTGSKNLFESNGLYLLTVEHEQ